MYFRFRSDLRLLNQSHTQNPQQHNDFTQITKMMLKRFNAKISLDLLDNTKSFTEVKAMS